MASFTLNSYSISYASGEVTGLSYTWDISNYSQAFLRITHPNSSITASTPVYPPAAPGSGNSFTAGISFTASTAGSYSVQAYVVRGGVEYTAGSAATFSVYSMSVSHGTGISSVSGSQLFTNNVSFSISATPASGYVFDGWYSDEGVKFSSTNPLTFNNSSTSRSLEARGLAAYTVTLYPTTETSAFYVPTGSGSYAAGSNVNININVKTGYRFLYWKDVSDTVIFTTASATITNISTDIFLWPVAEEIIYYNVTLDRDVTTITSVSGGGSKENGTIAIVSAVVASGYVFSHWEVGGSPVSTNNPYSFTVSGNVTLKAWGKLPVIRPNNWTGFDYIVSGYSMTVSGTAIYVMSATLWNDFTERINDFRSYKGLSNYSFTTVSSNTNCSAAIINEAINAINDVAGTSQSTVSSGQTIAASIFTTMKNNLNSII